MLSRRQAARSVAQHIESNQQNSWRHISGRSFFSGKSKMHLFALRPISSYPTKRMGMVPVHAAVPADRYRVSEIISQLEGHGPSKLSPPRQTAGMLQCGAPIPDPSTETPRLHRRRPTGWTVWPRTPCFRSISLAAFWVTGHIFFPTRSRRCCWTKKNQSYFLSRLSDLLVI